MAFNRTVVECSLPPRRKTTFNWSPTVRVLTSNAVSVPLDSIAFAWGAFGGLLPAAVVWSIVRSNVLVKGATTLLSLPLIYAVPDRREGKD